MFVFFETLRILLLSKTRNGNTNWGTTLLETAAPPTLQRHSNLFQFVHTEATFGACSTGAQWEAEIL